jgi:hypothetical protein
MSFFKDLSKMVSRADKKADQLADSARDLAADAAKRAGDFADDASREVNKLAAQAKREPQPPNPVPQAAMPAALGDVGIKAHIIMAAQTAATAQPPQAFAPAAPHGAPHCTPRGTPRGAECNLQA